MPTCLTFKIAKTSSPNSGMIMRMKIEPLSSTEVDSTPSNIYNGTLGTIYWGSRNNQPGITLSKDSAKKLATSSPGLAEENGGVRYKLVKRKFCHPFRNYQ